MKCKNCRFPEGSHPIRYNDSKECKQFIPSEDSTNYIGSNLGGKMAFCYNCNKFVSCPSCSALKQGAEVIKKAAEKHSKDVDEEVYNILTDSGSDIPLSKKIMIPRYKGWVPVISVKDVAEAVRKLKEAKQIGNNYYECGGSIWLKDSVIDKIFYPKGHEGEFK